MTPALVALPRPGPVRLQPLPITYAPMLLPWRKTEATPARKPPGNPVRWVGPVTPRQVSPVPARGVRVRRPGCLPRRNARRPSPGLGRATLGHTRTAGRPAYISRPLAASNTRGRLSGSRPLAPLRNSVRPADPPLAYLRVSKGPLSPPASPPGSKPPAPLVGRTPGPTGPADLTTTNQPGQARTMRTDRDRFDRPALDRLTALTETLTGLNALTLDAVDALIDDGPPGRPTNRILSIHVDLRAARNRIASALSQQVAARNTLDTLNWNLDAADRAARNETGPNNENN